MRAAILLLVAFLSACGTSAQSPGTDAAADAASQVGPAAGTTTRLTPAGASWWDPEVLTTTGGGLITWQDGNYEVWVASLDETSGLLVPGSEHLLGDRAAPLQQTFNGPEFGRDASGWSVYYTMRVQPGPVFQAVRARLVEGNAMLDVLTSGDPHFSPLASKDAGAAATRLILLRSEPLTWGTALWIDLADPGTEHDFAEVVNRPDLDARWIDGTFRFVTNNHPSIPGELSIVDTTTGVVTQISGGEGQFGNPYGWLAPEAGGDLYALATIDDRQVGIWGHDLGGWHLVTTVASPEIGFSFVGSPEPFVAKGRSYLSLVVATAPNPLPGTTEQHVWVVSVDPADSFARRCDDGTPGPVTRADPEILLGRDQAFVYYYTISSSGSITYGCATGVATR